MAWKYYRNGKLIRECNDIPETMEDAVIELQENGVDVSDCVVENSPLDEWCVDFWSPDYPPEDSEYQDTLMFKPLNEDDIIKLKKLLKALPKIKAPDGFTEKLWDRIHKEKNPLLNVSFYTKCKIWLKLWYRRTFR